jgi:hypothetical protein
MTEEKKALPRKTKEWEFYSRQPSPADEMLLEEFRRFDDRKMQAEVQKRGGKLEQRRIGR